MKNQDIEKYIEVFKEERKFLHDVSNYVVIMQGVGSYLRKIDLNNLDNIDTEKFEKRVNGLLNAVKKLTDDVNERRIKLKEVTEN